MVGLGQQAVFSCFHPDAPVLVWERNGSVVVDSPSDGIRTDRTRDEDDNVVEDTLTITAQSTYNDSEIVCMAAVVGEKTPPVTLLIQGKINLSSNYITGVTRSKPHTNYHWEKIDVPMYTYFW